MVFTGYVIGTFGATGNTGAGATTDGVTTVGTSGFVGTGTTFVTVGMIVGGATEVVDCPLAVE